MVEAYYASGITLLCQALVSVTLLVAPPMLHPSQVRPEDQPVPTPEVLQENAKKSYAENRKFLDSIRLFDGLAVKQKDRVGEAFFVEVFEEGARVVTEGEAPTAMYFLKLGQLTVYTGAKIGNDGKVTGGNEIARINAGESFGERALLYNENRESTVVAKQKSEVVVISGDQLKEVLGTNLKQTLEQNFILSGLKNSVVLSQFTIAQQSSIVKVVDIKDFKPGAKIPSGLRFGVVCDGELSGSNTGASITLGRGSCWEQDTLIHEGSAAMSARALKTAEAETALLNLDKGKGTLKDLSAGPGGARLGILSEDVLGKVLRDLGLKNLGDAEQAADFTRKKILCKKVICWESDEHKTLFALAILGILIAILSVVLTVMYRSPGLIRSAEGIVMLQQYRCLFALFLPGRYFWGAGDITRNLLFNLTLIVFPDTVTWQIMTMSSILLASPVITARLMPWRTAPANYSEMLTNLCLDSLNRRRKEEKEREFSAAQKIQSVHRGAAAGRTDAKRKQAEQLQRREEERRAAEMLQAKTRKKKLWQLVKAEEKAAKAAQKAAKAAQEDLISFKEREQKKLADFEEEREQLYERCQRIKSAAGEQAKLHADDFIRIQAMSRRLSEVAGSNPSEEVQQLLSNAAERMTRAKDAETFLSNLLREGPQAAERGDDPDAGTTDANAEHAAAADGNDGGARARPCDERREYTIRN